MGSHRVGHNLSDLAAAAAQKKKKKIKLKFTIQELLEGEGTIKSK